MLVKTEIKVDRFAHEPAPMDGLGVRAVFGYGDVEVFGDGV